MTLNQEEELFSGIKFENGCFMEGCPDTERENLNGLYDSKSKKIDEDIDDLLPNDPFGMGISINLPNDPFSMDTNISLPNDPLDMDINLIAHGSFCYEFHNKHHCRVYYWLD